MRERTLDRFSWPSSREFVIAVCGIPDNAEYVGKVHKTSLSVEPPFDTTKLDRMLWNPRSLPVITALFSTFHNPITTEELACALRRKTPYPYIDLVSIPEILAGLRKAGICELKDRIGSNIPQRWGLTGPALQYLTPKLCNFLPRKKI